MARDFVAIGALEGSTFIFQAPDAMRLSTGRVDAKRLATGLETWERIGQGRERREMRLEGRTMSFLDMEPSAFSMDFNVIFIHPEVLRNAEALGNIAIPGLGGYFTYLLVSRLDLSATTWILPRKTMGSHVVSSWILTTTHIYHVVFVLTSQNNQDFCCGEPSHWATLADLGTLQLLLKTCPETTTLNS